jgi:hypothetical protein
MKVLAGLAAYPWALYGTGRSRATVMLPTIIRPEKDSTTSASKGSELPLSRAVPDLFRNIHDFAIHFDPADMDIL